LDNQNDSMTDKKTILMIVLCVVVFVGWQMHLQKKYPKSDQKLTTTESTITDKVEPKQDSNFNQNNIEKNLSLSSNNLKESKNLEEEFFNFDTNFLEAKISNIGLGFTELKINDFKYRDGNNVVFNESGDRKYFQTKIENSNGTQEFLVFNINEQTNNRLVGVASTEDGTVVEKSITKESNGRSFIVELKMVKIGTLAKNLIQSIPSKDKKLDSSFLIPSMDKNEISIRSQGKTIHLPIYSEVKAGEDQFLDVKFISYGTQYYAAAVIDNSDIAPQARVKKEIDKSITTTLIYPLNPDFNGKIFSQQIFVGKKTLEILGQVNQDLVQLIDLGFFNKIGHFLLKLLKAIHAYVGNWGWAIVILTVLVRIVVFPFNLSGYKSMKKMQLIQPQITALREKFKDDPTRQQQELMSLMKTQKVNPLGGCLPTLLQMPVFFALFQVLGQSIELYQAPFIFWIGDLSAKDHFYILPIFMVAAMWLQTKLTPSTMDATQAKIMQFMPIIFGLMMINLPSGLTLYTFVSTAFGLAQQQYFMKKVNL
jgi:YidC/Oxa1 family membrane protein insertase